MASIEVIDRESTLVKVNEEEIFDSNTPLERPEKLNELNLNVLKTM